MKALILVDIQNDFLPGGTLAVPNGNEVVPVANQLIPKFDLVVATQDWHPANHGSFASQHSAEIGDVMDLNGLDQIMWPDHCVQGTAGAEFASELIMTDSVRVFPKGTDPTIDSYSGFFDNGKRRATGLGDFLKSAGIDHVIVLGLATDYCVKFTALDAVDLGFRTTLVEDGCRGVNLKPGDVARAVEQMRDAGVEVATSDLV